MRVNSTNNTGGGGDDAHARMALAATRLAGIVTGALSFVSAVDTRSFVAHVNNGSYTSTVKENFPVRWPNGRDFMVPLLLTTTALQGAAWKTSKDKNSTWAILECSCYSWGRALD